MATNFTNTIFRPPHPQDINDLALWLDASDESTIVLNGSDVAEWKDKSGNNNDSTQSNASYQPSYTQTRNGKKVVTFNGIHDLLTLGSKYIYSSSGGLTIFAVLRSNSNDDSVDKPISFGLEANQAYGMSFNNNKLEGYTSDAYGGGVTYVPNNNLSSSNFYVESFRITFNDKQELFLNNTLIGSDNITVPKLTATEIAEYPTRQNDKGPICIGSQSKNDTYGNRYFDGDIAEELIFTRNLTDEEITKIYQYLSKKWGVS